MKHLFYALLLLSLCSSCKSHSDKRTADSLYAAQVAADKSREIINKFKPIVQGVWVNKDYIDKVIRTKSPAEAVDLADDITTLYINTDNIKGDSLWVTVGWANHDGTTTMLNFKPGKEPSSIVFGGRDLTYTIKGRDTLLTYYYTEKNVTTPIKFIKALNKQPDDNLGFGTYYLVNKGLVAGKYTMTDSLNKSSGIVFTNDGTISGLADYKTYHINIDLDNEPMNNLDEISFDLYTKEVRNFTFKIIADTLNMYDTYPNADSTKLNVGKLKYKLVRAK